MFGRNGFEKAETDENRQQRIISKPAKRVAVHSSRTITYHKLMSCL